MLEWNTRATRDDAQLPLPLERCAGVALRSITAVQMLGWRYFFHPLLRCYEVRALALTRYCQYFIAIKGVVGKIYCAIL